MNTDNTEKLLAAYPLLYRNLRNRQFECGDGWFDLAWKMSAEIESSAHLEGITADASSWPSILVFKEKFCELRVSFSLTVKVSEEIRALAFKASMRSTRICEECGLPRESKVLLQPR
jgi:hypothetical protein